MDADWEFACEQCFKDDRLREWIRKNGRPSNCLWCGSHRVRVVALAELGPSFRAVAAIYEEGEVLDTGQQGDNIEFLLQEDWEIFSEKITDAPGDLVHELTLAILEAGLDPKNDIDCPDYRRGLFCERPAWLKEDWHERVAAVLGASKLEGNPLPKGETLASESFSVPPDVLEVVFEDLGNHYPEGHILYRARIHDNRFRTTRFAASELGAPEKARAARANRTGEPVLYLASDERTALAEVRAWKGTAVAIAQMKLRQRVFVIDLLKYELPKSPFFEEYLDWKLQLAVLFRRFGDELSQPVMPHEEETLYRPSQHLCELIRKAGYDGVAYPSAMGPGFNVVLFDPNAAEVINISYVRVQRVHHDVEVLEGEEPIYEEWPYQHLMKEDGGE